MPELILTRRLEEALAARGLTPDAAQPLAGDGSDRRFFRLLGSPTAVLLSHPYAPGDAVNENDSYYLIGRHLKARGVPVPEIHTYCREEGWMLLEDLGDISLETAARRQPGGEHLKHWYCRGLKVLVHQQVEGAKGFDPTWCFDTPEVNRSFLWDRECGYFVRAFLQGYQGLQIEMAELAPDFDRLLDRALSPEPVYFLHRDFQSRNLFIKDGEIRVIDFQGGRLGPLGYDVAALLIDPYVDLDPAWQEELLEYYLDLLAARLPLDRPAFKERFRHLALCRNLQILGAFGFLTRVKGKAQFARHIPAALRGLRRRLTAASGEFPRLAEVVAKLK